MDKPKRPRKLLLLLLLLTAALTVAGVFFMAFGQNRDSFPSAQTLLRDDFTSYQPGTRVEKDQSWEDVTTVPNGESRWYYSVGRIYHEPRVPADYTSDPQRFVAASIVSGSTDWTNYVLKARVEAIDDDGVGLIFRYQDINNYYRVFMVRDETHGGPYIVLEKKVNGNFETVKKVESGDGFHGDYQLGRWYALKLVAKGNNFEFFVDESLVLAASDNTFKQGKVGLTTWLQVGAFFDDVLVLGIK